MARRYALAVLVMITLMLSAYPVSTLSPPHVVNLIIDGRPSRLDVEGYVVAIVLPSTRKIGIYDYSPARENYFEVLLEFRPYKAVVDKNGTIYVIMENSEMLAAVDINEISISYFDLEFNPTDIAVDRDRIYLTDYPGKRIVVYGKTGGEIRKLSEYSVDVADLPDRITASGDMLWAVSSTYRVLTMINIKTGDIVQVDIGEIILALAGAGDGSVWAALNDGRIIKVSGSGEIVSEVELPEGTVVSPPLVVDEEGVVYYASNVRQVFGEVNEREISERRVKPLSPKFPSLGEDGKIWFIDSSTGRIAWISTSRPPTIDDVKIEYLGGGKISVTAVVKDPDGDLSEVILIAREFQGRFALSNNTLKLTREEDNIFKGEYNAAIKNGYVTLRVVAFDEPGNKAERESGRVNINIEEEQQAGNTAVTIISPTEEETGIDPTIIALLFSQLLLAIPLVFVILFIFTIRRRGKIKHRKRRGK